MRLSQVSSLAMVLALAACGGGDGDDDGSTLGGNLPSGASTPSSASGAGSVTVGSASSVTVTPTGGSATSFSNPTTNSSGVNVFTGGTTTAAVDEDSVYVSRVGAETLGATLDNTLYGVWAIDTGDPDPDFETDGFFAGVPATTLPTGTATYEGGAMALTEDASDGSVELLTGSSTFDADFGASTVEGTLDFDDDTGTDWGTVTTGTLSIADGDDDDTVANNFSGTSLTISNTGFGSPTSSSIEGTFMEGDELGGAFAATSTAATLRGSFGAAAATDDGGGDTTPTFDDLGDPVQSTALDARTDDGTVATLTLTDNNTVTVAINDLNSPFSEVYSETYTGSTAGSDGVLELQPPSGDTSDNAVLISQLGEETLGTTLDYTVYGLWSIDPDDDGTTDGTDFSENGAGFFAGVEMASGDMPTEGSATYTGGAMAVEEQGSDAVTRLTGTSSFDVDFGTGGVTGGVELGESTAGDWGTFDLPSGVTISGTGFSGTPTASEISNSNYSAGIEEADFSGTFMGDADNPAIELGGTFAAKASTGNTTPIRTLRGSFGAARGDIAAPSAE